jgi:hypothetical protein
MFDTSYVDKSEESLIHRLIGEGSGSTLLSRSPLFLGKKPVIIRNLYRLNPSPFYSLDIKEMDILISNMVIRITITGRGIGSSGLNYLEGKRHPGSR